MKFEFTVRTQEDLADAVRTFGFVPLFANSVPGFSVSEHVAPEAWFSDDREEGVWEWKGPVIRATGCAYGKFFERKAVFISPAWFPDFANLRRDGYDFDARCDEGLVPFADKLLYDLVETNGPLLSRRLKLLGDYRKGGRRGFDLSMNRLQAQGYVVIRDFVYALDRHGLPYGWGAAEYDIPERSMGEDFRAAVYRRTPEESYARILEHLQRLLPDTATDTLERLIR